MRPHRFSGLCIAGLALLALAAASPCMGAPSNVNTTITTGPPALFAICPTEQIFSVSPSDHVVADTTMMISKTRREVSSASKEFADVTNNPALKEGGVALAPTTVGTVTYFILTASSTIVSTNGPPNAMSGITDTSTGTAGSAGMKGLPATYLA